MAIATTAWLPSRLAALPPPPEGRAGLRLPGLLGLGTVFFTLAGIVGFWIFAEQVGAAGHIAPRLTGLAVAAALAAQVAGGAAATVLSGRLPPAPVLIAAGLLNIGVVTGLGTTLTVPAYFGGLMLFGFLWLFTMPVQVRLLIDVDPSRRAAMLLSTAQLLGSAAGPIVTSAFADGPVLTGALRADAVLFAVGVLFVVAVSVRK
jgi:MFS family permease